MTKLTPDNLGQLGIPVPAYDRTAVVPAVVHFGVGGFHRAHQAQYLDAVLAAGDPGWGICGVGLMPGDVVARDAAAAQDGLYTLVTTAPDGTEEARVIGSLVRYLYGPHDPAAVLEALASEQTRIVSLTITEGGYGVDDATGEFRPTDAATLADMAAAPGAHPASALGYLAEGLRLRRERGLAPFTVMTCDNVQDNGSVTRTALAGFVAARDEEFAAWIRDNVAFPSSMVDRITPVPTPEMVAQVSADFEVEDAWPIRSESFVQWVLEDNFPLGRPDLAAVGVQLVDDVEPYELMKLRLLNASHQAMSYVGVLLGHSWVHEVCRDEDAVAFLRGYMHDEAIPTLAPVPGVDLGEYCEQLLERFASEAVRDTLARQMVDGSQRLPKFLLPVLRHQLAAGGPVERCALVLVAWSLHLDSHNRDGAPELTDVLRDALLPLAARDAEAPGALLDHAPVFGDLGRDERLRRAYVEMRALLVEHGARAVLTNWAAAPRKMEN